MDEAKAKQVEENLNTMKEYIENWNLFPDNAGVRWIHESISKTLILFKEDSEPAAEKGFDAPTQEPESGSEAAEKVKEAVSKAVETAHEIVEKSAKAVKSTKEEE